MRNVIILSIFVCVMVLIPGFVSAESLIFQDNFTGGLAANWVTGTNTAINTAPTVGVNGGRVEWTQGWDYIESKTAFSGNIRVEIDLERISGSNQCKDFAIEFVNATGYTGALRLQYGSQAIDSINLGQGPALDNNHAGFAGVCIGDATGYQAEMATAAPHTGTAELVYNNGQIHFAFTNADGRSIQTANANAGTMAPSKIRIWAASNSRFVDAVRVYSLDGTPTNDCAYVDLSNADIVIPCLMIGDDQYSIVMHYDPAVPNGFYWELDPSSVELVN